MGYHIDFSLYLVTDDNALGGRDFLQSLEKGILGGVSVIQLREKNSSSLDFYNRAKKVKELTNKYGIPLIINDRIDIALAIDAEGVHLGQNDLPAKVARGLIGNKLLGISTATLEEALKAQQEGADYIGVGGLFPTITKADTRKVTLEEIKNIKEKVNIPVVGIGGINEENLSLVIATGIDGVAVASVILSAESIKETTMRLSRIIASKSK
ncbi:thiamine phosphate synthase [Alkaliphilus serpentinus]|uniref:Thiamine-phosphate synthase n=1 Tax=Alkaliphilus serpentinus TaxID=1482731 RepID=A0A833HQ65_9FIRM|nr:thiamine phosphate synthase [Alkaliphilus serpentinus]KAB3531528.1 thiamine phosphate synthase [Alkaliphilus serpentinus]